MRQNSLHIRILLSGTALLSSLAAPLHAQSSDPVALDPILVERRDEQSGAADRATAVYVADAELERARMGDLKDLFAGIASVSVGGAIPVAQKIFVNGIDMLNLAVTIDGVAQNNRAFHHVSANAIDPGLLKAVRADAGVAAADAGPNALAGAVVMETVDADDILDDGKSFGGNVRLGYVDNGKTFTRAATLAGKQGGFEWLGYLKSATGDDYETGAGNTVRGTAADLQSVLLKAAYETADGHRFELSGQRLRDDALRRYRANIDTAGGRPVPELRRYDTTRNSYAFSYHNTLAEGAWDPLVVIGYSESLINVPDPELSEGTTTAWSGKVQNTFHLAGEDTVVVGIDYYDRTGIYNDADENYRESARNIGLFAQARLEPMDGTKVSFGIRGDRQEFDGIGGFNDTVSGLSGNVSASYQLTDTLSLRGGYSTVFGGIAIEDNYIFFRSPRWDYTTLDAARAENFTLGFDYASAGLTLGGELFKTQVENARSESTNFDFESHGYNLGLGYGWDNGFARLTYSNSTVEVNGVGASSYDTIDFGAPLGQVIKFEVQHALVDTGFTVGGSLDVALDYDDMPSDTDLPIEGYNVVNVFAEYVPQSLPAMTIRAEVANLFDANYADRATYGADYSTITTLKEPGRAIALTATMRF